MISLVEKSAKFGHKTAIISKGVEYSYIDLFMAARSFAADLLDGIDDLYETKVGLLLQPGFEYVHAQWGTWIAGGVSIPFELTTNTNTLVEIIEESQITILIITPDYENVVKDACHKKSIRLIVMQDLLIFNEATLPEIDNTRKAMILFSAEADNNLQKQIYTHAEIEELISKNVKEGEWTSEDCMLCTLPLHQHQGIIEVLYTALFVGAVCEFL